MNEQDEAFEQWLTVGHHILCTDTKRAYHNAFGSGWDARGKHDAAERYAIQEALKRISKAEGRFSRDPLTHATNTIEDMVEIADAMIAKLEAGR